MITITKRPYLYNFTGNPVVYELTDPDAIADATLGFQVKILAKRLDEVVFSELTVLTIAPFNGSAQTDISSVLHVLLQHYIPPVNNGAVSYSSGTAALQFFIHFRTISPTDINPGWDISEADQLRWGFKGGVQSFRYRGNAFFTGYVINQKPFYTWQVRSKLAAANERLYLCWLNLLFENDLSTLKFKIDIFYTDQTNATKEYAVTGLQKGFMYYLPAGALENDLVAFIPAKKIWYWQCWLQDVTIGGLGIVTEKFTYVLDNRNDYNQLHIFYRNSLGGLDTVRLRGIIQQTLDYQNAIIEKSASPGFVDADQLPALQQSTAATEQLRYKAEMGHLSKDEQSRLRDALLNREAWMINNGRWWPLNLYVSGSIDFRRSDAMRWTMPIEFTVADAGNDYFTPDTVDLGNIAPSTNLCAVQVSINSHVLFPNSPSAGLTRAVISFTVAGDGAGLQWRILGESIWHDIAFTNAGTIEHAVLTDNAFVAQMRVACSPGNYGPIANYPVYTDGSAPAANSTIQNDTGLDSTWIIRVNGTQVAIGTVLAHSFALFYLAPLAAASLEMELGNINPGSCTLQHGGSIIDGDVDNNIVQWFNQTTDATGVLIIFPKPA